MWAAFGQALVGDNWDDDDDQDAAGGPFAPQLGVDPVAELAAAYERAVAEDWEHRHPEAFARLRLTYDTFHALVERRTPPADPDTTD